MFKLFKMLNSLELKAFEPIIEVENFISVIIW